MTGGLATNTGTGSPGAAYLVRPTYPLRSGSGVSLRFKVSTSNPTAIYGLESNSPSYQRFQVEVSGGAIVARVTFNNTSYATTVPMLANVKTNTWYRLALSINDQVGFLALVSEEANPQTRGTALLAMNQSSGRSWRFRQGITSGSTTLDAYHEMRGARFNYDLGTFGAGRRTRMAFNEYVTDWSYDARGRVSQTTYSGLSLPGARTFSWTYDSADRVTTMSYPAIGTAPAETITYSYNAAGQQSQVCRSGAGCYAQSARYEASGLPDHWKLGNSLIQNWMYDALNRPIRIQLGTDASVDQENDNLNATAASVFDRVYAYDPVGNLTDLTDQRGGRLPQTYTYDERDRLISWSLGGTTQSYQYDQIGNLTRKAGVTQQYGSGLNGSGTGPHQARRVGGVDYSYDANGNLTSGGGRTISWTPWNMPYQVTTASDGVTEQYEYDAENARIMRTRAGESTYYLGDLWEEDSNGTVRTYYTLGGRVVAMRTVTAGVERIQFPHGDSLGSVSVLTGGTSSAPTVDQQQEFGPWGNVRGGSISATRRNFTGQQLDATGLLFYHARYYDPAIGRFISADTVVPGSAALTVAPSDPVARGAWGGETSAPSNPQDLNRYSYALNNPLKHTDLTGHLPWALVGFAIGFGIDLGVQLWQNGGKVDQVNWMRICSGGWWPAS